MHWRLTTHCCWWQLLPNTSSLPSKSSAAVATSASQHCLFWACMFRPLCSKMSKLYFRTQYQQRKLTDLHIYRIWVGCLSVNALVDDRVVESLEIDRQMPHLSGSLYFYVFKFVILFANLTWSMSPPSQPMLPSGPLQSTRFCSDNDTNLPVACGTDVILIFTKW